MAALAMCESGVTRMGEGEQGLIGSRDWQRRRTRDPTTEIRRVYENLREFAAIERMTGWGESETGKTLTAPFTNRLELLDATRRAKFTSGEYMAFMFCIVGYAAAAHGVYPVSTWLPDGPLSYAEYAAEFHMDARIVAEKVASALGKLARLIYDTP